jgi:predicted transcriptional regulator of viral defense system
MAMPITNVGAVLTNLVHRGLVARVGRGRYVRTGAAA